MNLNVYRTHNVMVRFSRVATASKPNNGSLLVSLYIFFLLICWTFSVFVFIFIIFVFFFIADTLNELTWNLRSAMRIPFRFVKME